MTDKSAIESYYDNTWKDLELKGLTKPNTRHYMILDFMKKNGLTSSSKVLEIGCGIGTLSNLIGKSTKNGSLLAVDISPETIKLARNKFRNQRNIKFEVSDMSDWCSSEKFDVIILPDVLEHIPFKQYKNLFQKLKEVCHNSTKILINIPHPSAIEFYQQTNPEILQIIDLPVHVDILSRDVYSIGYMIDSIHPYNIDTDNNNYQFIVLVNKESPKRYVKRSRMKLFIQFWKFRFKYDFCF